MKAWLEGIHGMAHSTLFHAIVSSVNPIFSFMLTAELSFNILDQVLENSPQGVQRCEFARKNNGRFWGLT